MAFCSFFSLPGRLSPYTDYYSAKDLRKPLWSSPELFLHNDLLSHILSHESQPPLSPQTLLFCLLTSAKLLCGSCYELGHHMMREIGFLSPRHQNAVLPILQSAMSHCLILTTPSRTVVPLVMSPCGQRQKFCPLPVVHTISFLHNACLKAVWPVLLFCLKTFCIQMSQKRALEMESRFLLLT